MNIANEIRKAAQQWPQQIAFIEEEEGKTTYSQLFSQVDQLTELLKNCSIKPGMGMGMLAADGSKFVTGLLASSLTGATVLPFHEDTNAYAILKQSIDLNLGCILTCNNFLIKELGDRYVTVSLTGPWKLIIINPTYQRFAPEFPNAAFVRYTSGTTGEAKAVVLSHETVLSRLKSAQKSLSISQSDCVVWTMPMAYHFVVSLLLYMLKGATTLVAKTDNAGDFLKWIRKNNATLLYTNPETFSTLCSTGLEADLSFLRLAISTSAYLSPFTAESFRRQFNLEISPVYGIIEAGLPFGKFTACEHSNCIGTAAHDFEVAVFDRHQKRVKDGDIGRLAIKGPGICDGYLIPLKTRSDLMPFGWFPTGDLATLSHSGHITIHGRESSAIYLEDDWIFPEKIESVLNSFPGIKESHVFLDHPLSKGALLSANIKLETEGDLDAEEIREHCSKFLNDREIPASLVIVKELKKTLSGKMVRENSRKSENNQKVERTFSNSGHLKLMSRSSN